MLSRDEAWALIAARAAPLGIETVGLDCAVGRRLAVGASCRVDVPGFDRSAMDGYAVRSADTPGRLKVVGEVAAGGADVPIRPGECARIFTGGAIPPGADAVERQEIVAIDTDHAEFAALVPERQHIRTRGEDAARGAEVLAPGDVIRATSLGALAAGGIRSLDVYRRPQVALLATGDELVRHDQPLGPGQIYESNRITLANLARRAGASVLDLGTARDDLDEIEGRVRRGLREADVLIASGGVSVGDHDHVRAALERAGVAELFWRMSIKPGKPLFCGRAATGTWAFALPGNPTAAVVGFLSIVAPTLSLLQGDADPREARRLVRAACDLQATDDRRHYLTACLRPGGDGADEAIPTTAQGAARTMALARADLLLVLAEHGPAVPAGTLVPAIEL